MTDETRPSTYRARYRGGAPGQSEPVGDGRRVRGGRDVDRRGGARRAGSRSRQARCRSCGVGRARSHSDAEPASPPPSRRGAPPPRRSAPAVDHAAGCRRTAADPVGARPSAGGRAGPSARSSARSLTGALLGAGVRRLLSTCPLPPQPSAPAPTGT